MTPDEKAKMIDKLRKILALAQSENEHEATLAAERGHAMLAEYNLTLDDLKEEISGIIKEELFKTASPWRRNLASSVAKLYFCRHYYRAGSPKDTHAFIGREHNVIVAMLMFEYLSTAIKALASAGSKAVPKHEQLTYRKAFTGSATIRLRTRINERIAAARAGEIKMEGDGRNLPALASLYDQAANDIAIWLEQQGVHLSAGKQKATPFHALGIEHGVKVGDRLGLDTQIKHDVKLALK